VFFCKTAGKIHRCSKTCSQTTHREVEKGLIMCRVSGIVYGQEEVALYTCQISQRTSRLYKDPYEHHRNEMRTISNTLPFESAFRCQALNTVRLLIFSKRRVYAERKLRLCAHEATKKQLALYEKFCKRTRRTIMFPHLLCLAVHGRRRQGTGTYQKEKQAETEQQCAAACVRVWTRMCKYTTLKTHISMTRSLQIAATALLYLMKSGLPMNNVQIIPKDYFLEAALLAANTLHHYGISRGQFTSMKNEIRTAIRSAIQSKLINPRVLATY
jgi:hypothetical protein